MLKNYSWGDFLVFVTTAVAIYYLVVGFLYFRGDIKKLVLRKWRYGAEHADEEETREVSEDGFEELESVVLNIRHELEQLGKGTDKGTVLQTVRSKLHHYDGLHNPGFRAAIRNYVITHGESVCGIQLTDEDLEADWQLIKSG